MAVKNSEGPLIEGLLRLSGNSTKAVKMGQLFNELNPDILNGDQPVSAGYFRAEVDSLSEIGHVLVDRTKTDGPTVAFTVEGLEHAVKNYGTR